MEATMKPGPPELGESDQILLASWLEEYMIKSNECDNLSYAQIADRINSDSMADKIAISAIIEPAHINQSMRNRSKRLNYARQK